MLNTFLSCNDSGILCSLACKSSLDFSISAYVYKKRTQNKSIYLPVIPSCCSSQSSTLCFANARSVLYLYLFCRGSNLLQENRMGEFISTTLPDIPALSNNKEIRRVSHLSHPTPPPSSHPFHTWLMCSAVYSMSTDIHNISPSPLATKLDQLLWQILNCYWKTPSFSSFCCLCNIYRCSRWDMASSYEARARKHTTLWHVTHTDYAKMLQGREEDNIWNSLHLIAVLHLQQHLVPAWMEM